MKSEIKFLQNPGSQPKTTEQDHHRMHYMKTERFSENFILQLSIQLSTKVSWQSEKDDFYQS